jgi:hypothetical protein
MFSLPVYVEDLRKEKRHLSVYSQQLERSVKRQKEINENCLPLLDVFYNVFKFINEKI